MERILVHCRLRPQNAKEKREDGRECTSVTGNIVKLGESKSGAYGSASCDEFAFDAVHGFEASQREVYESVAQPLVQEVFAGFNVTIFAYGQTGSGKTFSLMGPEGGRGSLEDEQRGIVPRVVQEVYAEAAAQLAQGVSATITLCVLELYLDQLRDLLLDEEDDCAGALALHEDADGAVYVAGQKELRPPTADAALELLAKAQRQRATSATKMNADSSRSHLVTTLKVETGDAATGAVTPRFFNSMMMMMMMMMMMTSETQFSPILSQKESLKATR